MGDRQREATLARAIVEEEVTAFQGWLQTLLVVPILVSFREWATEVKDGELERFLAKMPDLSDDERKKVGALAHAIVNKLVHPPTARIKDMAGDEDGYRYAEALRVLFDLDGVTQESEGSPSGPRRLGHHPPACRVRSMRHTRAEPAREARGSNHRFAGQRDRASAGTAASPLRRPDTH